MLRANDGSNSRNVCAGRSLPRSALAPKGTPVQDFTRRTSARPSRLLLSVLPPRVVALGRALLFAGGLALSAFGSTASANHTSSVEVAPTAHRAHATIESREAMPADHVKTGEQLPMVSVEVRSVLRAPVSGAALSARAPSHGLGADGLRWCDVIQCRRLGGALLLGFATPPPTHS